MNITIAIDSLKGSLSSLEAGHAIEEGIRRVYKDAAVNVRPLADGGEGTVEALACGMGGTLETVTVTGPMGRPVDCQYGILPESGTAIIEMSGAAGITLVPDAEKDPMKTTTFGVGEVIRAAIQKGCRRFIVGIGGSATNDGGAGMLQALGYGILDRDGNQIPPGAQGLAQIASISSEHVLPELSECTFRIACDVNNPLCGPRGASAVYGPQKGADEAMVQVMDRGLAHFAEIAGKWNPKADPEFPGTGAAGGLGFAFLTFTRAVLESGIQIVLEETKLREYVKDADLVITFHKGDAAHLEDPDETFDATVSNFVFHEVRSAKDKRDVVREALRIVKKGGAFSFQDMFSQKALYGDMEEFVEELKKEGITEIHYIGNLEKKLDFILGYAAAPWMISGMGILYGRK